MTTTNPRLIGLTGPAGAGKDTVADLLTHTQGWAKMAFADALRAEVVASFGVPLDHLTNPHTKEHPISSLALAKCSTPDFLTAVDAVHRVFGGMNRKTPRSPRQILQWWGTEYRRRQDPQYWIKFATHRMLWVLDVNRTPGLVVTDVRFENEAAAIRKLGGVIWQVQRPGLAHVEGGHASAVTGAEFAPDLVVDNSGDLPHLAAVVDGLMGVAA